MKRLSKLDYSEIGYPHPIPANAMLVLQGLMSPEEALKQARKAVAKERRRRAKVDNST